MSKKVFEGCKYQSTTVIKKKKRVACKKLGVLAPLGKNSMI